jgi:hypothetical protein
MLVVALGRVEGVSEVSVAGNTALTAPELVELLSVAPKTVKKLAPTPVRVYPAAGVTVMFAV